MQTYCLLFSNKKSSENGIIKDIKILDCRQQGADSHWTPTETGTGKVKSPVPRPASSSGASIRSQRRWSKRARSTRNWGRAARDHGKEKEERRHDVSHPFPFPSSLARPPLSQWKRRLGTRQFPASKALTGHKSFYNGIRCFETLVHIVFQIQSYLSWIPSDLCRSSVS